MFLVKGPHVNSKPVAIATSYLPARLFSGVDKQELEQQSLYHVMEHIYKRKLHWADEIIGAVTAKQEDAEILETVEATGCCIVGGEPAGAMLALARRGVRVTLLEMHHDFDSRRRCAPFQRRASA